MEAVLDPIRIPRNKDEESESESESDGDVADESPAVVEKQPEESSNEEEIPSRSQDGVREVEWVRRAKTRPNKERTDIFYYEKGEKERLKSLKSVRDYCERKNIKFVPSMFDYSGKNKYQGVIGSMQDSGSSEHSSI